MLLPVVANIVRRTPSKLLYELITGDSQISLPLMAGIEIREGDQCLFRGGIMDLGAYYVLYNEDGTREAMLGISYVGSDGIERDENGEPVDRNKPSVTTLYELTHDPELTHRGNGSVWFGGVLICVINAISILFADEFFRLNLLRYIRNADQAEPSDWEIGSRYLGWTIAMFMALAVFLMGLQ